MTKSLCHVRPVGGGWSVCPAGHPEAIAVAALTASPVAQAFSRVAILKLQNLMDRGYVINGLCFEKPVEGREPERGFITDGGFVGWWRSDQAENEHVPAVVLENGAESNMTGGAYAELPAATHCKHLSGSAYPDRTGSLKLMDLFTADQMRDFADATHALRASHGQAPAGATTGVTEQIRQAYGLVKAHAFDLPDDHSHKSLWDEQAQSLGKALDDLLAHTPTAQAAPAAELENLQRTASGWQERALHAERNWAVCRRWAIAGGAPVEKLGDDIAVPWHEAAPAAGAVAGPKETLAEWALRATPEEFNAANWGVVHQGLLRAREELEKTGVVHSWIGPYIGIARQESQRVSPTPAARVDSQPEDENDAHNFAICQHFDHWLIEKGALLTPHSEESDGPMAPALNWIASVEAMVAASAKADSGVQEDAARYRWLRDGTVIDGAINDELYVHVDSSSYPGRWALAGAELDEAVDAALAAKGGA